MATTPPTAPTTDLARPASRWARALEGDAEALRELAASYWYPVYAWWRRSGFDDAGTLTQACFARWLTAVPPQATEPGAARLREWLLAQLPALAAEGVAGAVDVAAGQRSVTVSDPSADRETRARTDVIIRSVYAGAQLPEPSIEHRWISQSHAERLAAARQHRRAGDESALAAANAHRDDDLMTLGAPAAGRRAAAAQAPASGAPVETRPVVLPVGRITATCNEKMANASLLRKSWVMWGCMRTSCCASSTAEHSEECRAYGQTYPLTCPAR